MSLSSLCFQGIVVASFYLFFTEAFLSLSRTPSSSSFSFLSSSSASSSPFEACSPSNALWATQTQNEQLSTVAEGDRLFQSIYVRNIETGKDSSLATLLSSTQPTVVCWFTHLGDFNSFEYGQKLKYSLPELLARNVKVVAIGIGSQENGLEFCKCFNFPRELLYVDENAASYRTMGFSKGFAPDVPVNPYFKLLPMLMGIGSPGTIQAVLRGYVGSRQDNSDWAESYLNLVDRSAFDVLGTKGARPFEIATVRLQNMMNIIPKWELLAPKNKDLITQQGGTAIFDQNKKQQWCYKDKGILVYTNIDDVLDKLDSL